MTAEMKAKWLEALRSGKYKQGREYLRLNDTFCCLGVLCDIQEGRWIEKKEGWSDPDIAYSTPEDPDEWLWPQAERMAKCGLPPEVADKAGQMNDSNRSFAEIADWLEANLPVSA